MTPWKICAICGEYKEHRAKNLCKNCYSREYRKVKFPNTKSDDIVKGEKDDIEVMRSWKVCIICGKYRKHCARGMCRSCYYRERYRKPQNIKSPIYLGCHVAEKVLSNVFKDVKVMKAGNPGFDFICNKGKKIDVKSSCIGKKGNWLFAINKNTLANFFLCIAFDDRESLTPLHLWLLPSSEVKDKSAVSIRPSTLHKWDEFKLDISKTLQCCDEMRG